MKTNKDIKPMNVKRKKSGFTVVELLTVLAIITMLVGLLVPALNLVKNITKETKEKSQLATIGLALTTFKNDSEYGDYPPSVWPDLNPPPQPPSTDYCGAQKLAEALLGRDLLGFHPKSTWSATDPTWYPDPTTTPPAVFETNLRERRGPYLEPATANAFRLGVNVARPDPEGLFNDTTPLHPDTFVICDVFSVKSIKIGPKTVKAGTPILYYRANTSSKTIEPPALPQDRIYNFLDNQALIALKRLPDQTRDHRLGDTTGFLPFFYVEYIKDPKITARPWPYRPDSYLLISAGLDGEYGTKDDIRNFGN